MQHSVRIDTHKYTKQNLHLNSSDFEEKHNACALDTAHCKLDVIKRIVCVCVCVSKSATHIHTHTHTRDQESERERERARVSE
jgi:hypothetical protein